MNPNIASASASPLPAHHTKHLRILSYPFASSTFHLSQLDDGISNGTALWLGAQCLSLYLASSHNKLGSLKSGKRPRAVELGSGIGLTALALASLGWDVLATDIPDVISTVLAQNVANNAASLPINSGSIQIRELDWTSSTPSDQWRWDDRGVIASGSSLSSNISPSASPSNPIELLKPPFDLIISADTVYIPALAEPLLRTFHALSTLSLSASPPSARPPPIYLCLERRDPALVDRLLADAKNIWRFNVERVPHRKLVKAMEKGAIRWNKDEWEGVEIWKLVLARG